MPLNKFVNSGTDESILKSMEGDSVHVDQEVLVKAMNKAGLVQKDVQVQTKTGTFTRKQWVKANEDQSTQKQPAGKQYEKKNKSNAQTITHNNTEYKFEVSPSSRYKGDCDIKITNTSTGASFVYHDVPKSKFDGMNDESKIKAFVSGRTVLSNDNTIKKPSERKAEQKPVGKFRKVSNRDDVTNGIRAINRAFGKDKNVFNAISEVDDNAYSRLNNDSGFDAPITIMVAKKVSADDFLEQFKKEFGIKPKHNVNQGSSGTLFVTIEGADLKEDWRKKKSDGNSAKYKAGDEVTVNGKTVKILKIMPDDGKNSTHGPRYQVERDGIISHVSEIAISGKADDTTQSIYSAKDFKITNFKWKGTNVNKYKGEDAEDFEGVILGTKVHGTSAESSNAKVGDVVIIENGTHNEAIGVVTAMDRDPRYPDNINFYCNCKDSDGKTYQYSFYVGEDSHIKILDMRKPQPTHPNPNTDPGGTEQGQPVPNKKPVKKVDSKPTPIPNNPSPDKKDDGFSIPDEKDKKLSKEDAKKKTQSITASIGKTDKERNDFMAKAKAQGITWKENDHVGINWMRCCMAMNSHFENGGNWSESDKKVPNKTTVDGKTFKVKDINGQPTIEISMYDTQKRINKVEKFAKENGIKVSYTR